MDLENVLDELRRERDAIDAAILSLERLNRVGLPGAARLSDWAARKPKNGELLCTPESEPGRDRLSSL